MRARFRKIAAGFAMPHAAPDGIPAAAHRTFSAPDGTLAAVQRLNYDILFIIFVMSFSEGRTAALTLSSLCSLWRSTALSMPQIWSVIQLDGFSGSYRLQLFLERSKPLPLHIFILGGSSQKELKVLSSATDRVVCMTISDCRGFLLNQFPILERLDLLEMTYRNVGHGQYLLKESRFPLLRELCLLRATENTLCRISVPPNGFAGLQKLEIVCRYPSHWLGIVQCVSSTLVSLALCFPYHPDHPTYQFSFPQLRHLQVNSDAATAPLVLDLDAPRLKSVEQGFGVGNTDDVLIRLRNPRSVKHLCIEYDPLDLTLYPALRKLWIKGRTDYNHIILQSLRYQIASCPELEAIFYCAQPTYAGYRYYRNGPEFLAILDLVRETGRDIAVNEFLETELDLPGAMQRRTGCLGSPCSRE